MNPNENSQFIECPDLSINFIGISSTSASVCKLFKKENQNISSLIRERVKINGIYKCQKIITYPTVSIADRIFTQIT